MLLIVACTVIGLHWSSSPHLPLTSCHTHSSSHAPPTPHPMPNPPLTPCPTHLSSANSEHLSFEASSLYPNRKCSGNDTWKFCDLVLCPPNCTFDDVSYSFSVECPVQGYPPYKSISWDLARWEHLRPCVSFSNGNRTATFRAAKEFVELQHTKLKCIAHNGLDMLTGTRTVDLPSFINSGLRDLFAEPLQMQTAGPVELSPFGNASFVCASKSYDVYRVCKVEYTMLTLVQRCAASGLAASTTCCTVGRYLSPNCSSGLHAEVHSGRAWHRLRHERDYVTAGALPVPSVQRFGERLSVHWRPHPSGPATKQHRGHTSLNAKHEHPFLSATHVYVLVSCVCEYDRCAAGCAGCAGCGCRCGLLQGSEEALVHIRCRGSALSAAQLNPLQHGEQHRSRVGPHHELCGAAYARGRQPAARRWEGWHRTS